jgi:hypothetical protein
MLVAQRAQAGQESIGGHLDAASPWIGSTRKPAVCGPIAAFTASRSPNSTYLKPGSRGRKPLCIFSWCCWR